MDPDVRIIPLVIWQLEAEVLFGPNRNLWRFVCPGCGRVQCRGDFLDLTVFPENADQIAGFSCIDRWQTQACMQVGGPVHLEISPGEIRPMFEFNKP